MKLATLEETRLFVAELLRADLPARTIVDSDFTFLNERLANHYGLSDVRGARMRKVHLPKDSERGGLMTQASVLKVTANGTTTSPVLRGYWITERILGYQIPPPPPAAAVEPDIRGAVTLRQQLEKHRNDASCASCHSKMDPPGFALDLMFAGAVVSGVSEEIVIDFEQAEIGKPMTNWVEKGVVFALAHHRKKAKPSDASCFFPILR